MDKLLGSLLMVIFVANLIWIIYIIIKEYKKDSTSLFRSIFFVIFNIVFDNYSLYAVFVVSSFLFGVILLFY
ncbi:hypothetical protein ATY39_12815 [Rummeliibacillus stabekisii]|uniref:Uncharacterized protein n=1 Tax=Rummeliibacillus stabekisii TaxID=241244 RepID=A0A143HG37_9BACL|nr:hypothetical protein ATY39_12815 [Rummeliibacillus stabekisii]